MSRCVNVKVLIIFDSVLAFVCILIQSRYLQISSNFASNYDKVGAGIWGGFVILAAARAVWKRTSNNEDVNHRDRKIMAVSLISSVVCGALLTYLSSVGHEELVQLCPLQTFYGTYDCALELALEKLLTYCGLTIVLVNIGLIYSVVYKTRTTAKVGES